MKSKLKELREKRKLKEILRATQGKATVKYFKENR